jgi:hypothetical protein
MPLCWPLPVVMAVVAPTVQVGFSPEGSALQQVLNMGTDWQSTY